MPPSAGEFHFLISLQVMKFFTVYKPFYKNNLRLALPVILSQMGQITVQLADTAMVGRYGGEDPTPLAAVAFGTSVFFIVFIAAMGLSFGLTPLVGEYFAKDDKRYAAELLQNGAVLFMLTGLVASAALVALRPLLSILGGAMMDSGSDASIAEVIDMALPYYDTLVWSVFPAMIFFTFKQFLEGIGNTRTAMVVIIICNAVNILFNWMLIFGKCGFEPMGAVGAGIARGMTNRLLMSNAFKDGLCALVENHSDTVAATPRSVKRALAKLGGDVERLRSLLALKRADIRAHAPAYRSQTASIDDIERTLDAIVAEGEAFSVAQLAIGGRDVIATGVAEGPAVGAALQAALDAVIEGSVENERAQLLAFLRQPTTR